MATVVEVPPVLDVKETEPPLKEAEDVPVVENKENSILEEPNVEEEPVAESPDEKEKDVEDKEKLVEEKSKEVKEVAPKRKKAEPKSKKRKSTNSDEGPRRRSARLSSH